MVLFSSSVSSSTVSASLLLYMLALMEYLLCRAGAAAAVYQLAARFNHSCRPNCVYALPCPGSPCKHPLVLPLLGNITLKETTVCLAEPC